MGNRTLTLLAILWISYAVNSYAQMQIEGVTHYGNEWIESGKDYYKIEITEDGLYKLTAEEIRKAGLSGFTGNELALIHNSKPLTFYVSNDGQWTTEDFLLFKGEKNRAYLDQFMYEGGMDWVLNPNYSLITDTSAYYLVVDKSKAMHYDLVDNSIDENLTAKSWHSYTDRIEYNEEYHKKYIKSSVLNILESHFVEDEGWASSNLRTFNLDFIPDKAVADSMVAEYSIRLISDYNPHELSLTLNNDTVFHEALDRFELLDKSFEVPASELRKSRVRLRVRGEIDGLDRYRIVSASIKYARKTSSIDGQTFSDILTQNKYYEITEIENTNPAWIISGNYILQSIVEGESHIINASEFSEGELLNLYSDSAIKEAAIASKVASLTYADLKETDLIFLTSRLISEKVPSLAEYKEYRESLEGGNFKTAIVNVEDLYEQFAYGVKRHPMAIKNFLHYLDNIGTDLRFVFLVGKGIEHISSRTEEDFESPLVREFRIPSFGYPSSDDLLCSPTDRIAPLYAVGRLSFNTEKDIALYLDKVKVNEADYNNPNVEESIWKKRLLHLNAGGVGEHQTIAGHFNAMATISKSSQLNPDISTFVKTSNEPIQFTEIEQVFNEINSGVKFVTFFGHSNTVALAFDLERRASYDNYNKMPLLIALGCSAGNLNIVGKSLGEIYGGYDTGGFLGLWSSTHFAFISSLGVLGRNFYDIALNNSEGYRLGEVIQKTIESTGSNRRVCEQMMLFGDPALKFSVPEGPDPALDVNSVNHSPERPTPDTENLEIEFTVTNLGLVSNDSIKLDYKHTYPDGTVKVIEIGNIQVPVYKDTHKIIVPIDSSMAGINKFNVRINQDRQLQEWPENSAYDNNDLISVGMSGGYEVYIRSNMVNAIYPMDYAIVPSSRQEIVVSGSPYVHDSIHVKVELDTTRFFNSPIKISDDFYLYGGTKRWEIPLELEEDVVYYWRVKAMDENEESGKWDDKSFIYLEGKTGWNQSHYFQFTDDEYEKLLLTSWRQFVQDSFIYSWTVDNKLKENNNGISIMYNGEVLNQSTFWLSGFSGAYIILLNSKTGNLAETNPPGGLYGSYNPRTGTIRTFAYDLSVDSSRIHMINFLENIIAEDRNVILIFHRDALQDSFKVNEWEADSLINNGKNIFNTLESFGAKEVRQMKEKGDVQYVFMYKNKGRVYAEGIGEDEIAVLSVTGDIRNPEKEGILNSTLIEGFKSMEAIDYSIQMVDSTDYHLLSFQKLGDTIPILTDNSIEGYNLILLDTLTIQNEDVYNFHWILGNDDYEILPQIEHWRIYGEMFGDYFLTAGEELKKNVETIDNFDHLNADFYIHNYSYSTLDTGRIEITLTDERNSIIYSSSYEIPENIIVLDSLYQSLSIPIDTRSKSLRLHIELIIPDEYPELTKLNNVLIKEYRVVQDDVGPFLTVYFDGERISNGDIVSPTVLIEVAIHDETEVIPLSDTSNVSFSFISPSLKVMDYDFSSPNVTFIPANPYTAYLRIEGDFKEEGLYTFKVNAKDKTGNIAGEMDYVIQFRIVSENGISLFDNYPNPFRGGTQFKYTLTGDNTPPDYTMMIVDVQGRIVAELNESHLGPLRIGEHSTDVWYATGADGQPLSPGVYFYKLNLNTENSYKHIEKTTDSFYKNGWGKMMIIR